MQRLENRIREHSGYHRTDSEAYGQLWSQECCHVLQVSALLGGGVGISIRVLKKIQKSCRNSFSKDHSKVIDLTYKDFVYFRNPISYWDSQKDSEWNMLQLLTGNSNMMHCGILFQYMSSLLIEKPCHLVNYCSDGAALVGQFICAYNCIQLLQQTQEVEVYIQVLQARQRRKEFVNSLVSIHADLVWLCYLPYLHYYENKSITT